MLQPTYGCNKLGCKAEPNPPMELCFVFLFCFFSVTSDPELASRESKEHHLPKSEWLPPQLSLFSLHLAFNLYSVVRMPPILTCSQLSGASTALISK